MPSLRSLLYPLMAFLLAACAAGPELAKYPRAEIDRPYTLPKGVAAWQTLLPYSFAKDASGFRTLPPVIPVPLFWKSSLSDNVTLNWVPLPLLFSFQLDYSDKQLIGVDAGVGGGYASGSVGAIIEPVASVFYRRKLTKTIAAEAKFAGDFTYWTGSKESFWDIGLTLGPRFQLSEVFSLRPAAEIQLSYANFQLINPVLVGVLPPKTTMFRLPLKLSLSWSISRQWDLGFNYVYQGIGEPNRYSNHSGALSATHFW